MTRLTDTKLLRVYYEEVYFCNWVMSWAAPYDYVIRTCSFLIWLQSYFIQDRVPDIMRFQIPPITLPMTSLKVSIINFISWTESWLLKVFYAISVTRALSRTSWMFVVKQVPVCNFILLIFACVVLRKMHVHSLFTLETVGFPECLLFLDSDKQLNQ